MTAQDEQGHLIDGVRSAGIRLGMTRLSRRAAFRLLAVGAGAAALPALLGACGAPVSPPPSTTAPPGSPTPGQPRRGGTLGVALATDPEILDPHLTTNTGAGRVLALLHNTLIERDFDGSFKPGLAEHWEVSPDGKTYTFALRSGVTFHSGKALTAEDVRYTFERWRTLPKSPTASSLEPVEVVEAPDASTVRVRLKTPYNILLDQLAGQWAVILNREAVERAGASYGVTTVDGTGPFRFVAWERGQKLTVARHDAFAWGSPASQNQGAAYLDGVEFRILPEDATRITELRTGGVHIVGDVPGAEATRLADAVGVSVHRYDQLTTHFLGFNMKRPPLDDLRVRQAITHALDRQAIVQGALFGLGKPLRTMLAPATPGYWPGGESLTPAEDSARAMALLDEAGWRPGPDGVRVKDGRPLVLPLWVINTSVWMLLAQIVEQQLGRVGIKVETEPYESTAFFAALRGGEHTAFALNVNYDSADVLNFYFHSKQQPAPNRFGFSVPEVDAWLEEARTATDPAVVTRAYEQIQRRLIADLPTTPVLSAAGMLAAGSHVQGIRVHPSRWLGRMTDLWLAT